MIEIELGLAICLAFAGGLLLGLLITEGTP